MKDTILIWIDSKEQQNHKEIDQEINIILGENQTQTGSFGLNTVEKLKDSYIVQRDIELETDFILSICSDIAEFNTEQLNDYPVAEGQISDEKEAIKWFREIVASFEDWK